LAYAVNPAGLIMQIELGYARERERDVRTVWDEVMLEGKLSTLA